MTRSWLVLLLVFSGCQCAGTDVTTPVFHCAADGDCAAGFFCSSSVCIADGTAQDGGGSDAGVNSDAGSDAGAGADSGSNDGGADACTPESDQQLCAAAGETCGTVTATDNCGTVRTPNCGGCPMGDACDSGQCVTVPDGGPCPGGGVPCAMVCCPNGQTCAMGACCSAPCGAGCCTSTQTCLGTSCCNSAKVCAGTCCGAGLTCINTACCTAAFYSWEQVNTSVATSVGAVRTVRFPQPQSPGDLNVVVVGLGDVSTQILSVTDSTGNTYARAVGPTVGAGLSQSIYYAADIASAAAGNTVTVTFNQPPASADIRIGEIAGIALVTPFDTADGGAGNGAVAHSGEITVAATRELLIGAGTAKSGFADAGNNWILKIISPTDNLVEGKGSGVAGSTGSATAIPKAGTLNDWVMQIVAFKGC